jgi:hypothetical protein
MHLTFILRELAKVAGVSEMRVSDFFDSHFCPRLCVRVCVCVCVCVLRAEVYILARSFARKLAKWPEI